MTVMFVHFSTDSGDVLCFSHLPLKLAFRITDDMFPACNGKLNAQHFLQMREPCFLGLKNQSLTLSSLGGRNSGGFASL